MYMARGFIIRVFSGAVISAVPSNSAFKVLAISHRPLDVKPCRNNILFSLTIYFFPINNLHAKFSKIIIIHFMYII